MTLPDYSNRTCFKQKVLTRLGSLAYFVVIVLLFPICGAEQQHSGDPRMPSGRGCSHVKHAYGSKGFNEHDVPHYMIPGGHLQVCQNQFTCCTLEMEGKLNVQSNHDIGQLIMDKLNSYRQNFVTRLIKFDEFFIEVIDQSRADLHDMFLRTYGQLYQQNVQLFVDLFHELQSYYKRTNVSIADVLDRFFSLLMQRIFRLLNDQHLFSDGFFNCIDEHMNRLKPFGDIPLKLYLRMKRSFSASRVFVDGLATGRDIILAMSKNEHSLACSNDFMKLTYCSYCGGFENIKPCTNYCRTVLRECVGYYSNVNKLWNIYLGELHTLAIRLDGPFNMEMVVSPLGVKISEAIMYFQENSGSFTTKVFLGCGEPKLRHHSSHNETRKRRESSTVFHNFHTTNSPNSMPEKFNHSIFWVPKTNNLSRLIHDVQLKIDAMHDIWRYLPEALCNDSSLAEPDDAQHSCWNGSYAQSDTNNFGKDNFKSGEETPSRYERHNAIIEKVLHELRTIISRIRNAHSGIDENLSDIDDDSSGSGHSEETSGSGGTGDPYELHTTKDIYIEAISSSPASAVDDTNEHIVKSSTKQTIIIINVASHRCTALPTSLAAFILLWTVSFMTS